MTSGSPRSPRWAPRAWPRRCPASPAALVARAPEVGGGILRGQTALAAEPRYAPKEGTEGQAFKEGLDAALPPTAFGIGARTGETGGYAVIREAVRARYADPSAPPPATPAASSTRSRLQRAVDDVTGGVLNHNGQLGRSRQRAACPRRNSMPCCSASPTPTSPAYARSAGHADHRSEYLRGGAKLETIGDGRLPRAC